MPKLLTETNTIAVERQVMALAAKRLNQVHHHLDVAFEHGQWWVTCKDCGASWSVVDVEPTAQPSRYASEKAPESLAVLDFERIETGDETCFSRTGGAAWLDR